MKRSLLTLTLSALAATAAHAQADFILLGQPAIGGNGCQQADIYLTGASIDDFSLVIQTNGLTAVSDTTRPIDRQTCSLAIPFEVPQGKQLVLRSQSVRGRANLASGTQARVTSELFFAGLRGPVLSKTLVGATYQRIRERADVELRSACGASSIIRLNSNVTLTGRRTQSDSEASLSRLVLDLQLEDCL